MGGGGGGGNFSGTRGSAIGYERMGRNKRNAPRSNQQQNKQVRDIVTRLKLTPAQQRELHDAITGQGFGFQEIWTLANEMFGKK